MQLSSRSPSFTIGLRAICPFFHYSVPASCIVTTTNFLAVYKAVNQNHTEQGVEVGGAGAELGGLSVRAARPWTRCQSFTRQGNDKREAEGGGRVQV